MASGVLLGAVIWGVTLAAAYFGQSSDSRDVLTVIVGVPIAIWWGSREWRFRRSALRTGRAAPPSLRRLIVPLSIVAGVAGLIGFGTGERIPLLLGLVCGVIAWAIESARHVPE